VELRKHHHDHISCGKFAMGKLVAEEHKYNAGPFCVRGTNFRESLICTSITLSKQMDK
jgi:hypothetical protein